MHNAECNYAAILYINPQHYSEYPYSKMRHYSSHLCCLCTSGQVTFCCSFCLKPVTTNERMRALASQQEIGMWASDKMGTALVF